MFEQSKETGMPGISEFTSPKTQNPYANYNVKYLKIDMDSPTAVGDLQSIETRALRGENVAILTRDKFTFMDRYFMIISYLEENSL
jgi:hypothetical protein